MRGFQQVRLTNLICALGAVGIVATTSNVAALPLFSDGFETGQLCIWSNDLAPYTEVFDFPDGAAWPGIWTAAGGTGVSDVQAGRARFRPTPSGYSLARMVAPINTRDVEVLFTMVFEDVATQGVGFYVRQNGGYLDQTFPTGQGYAVFVEGFRATPGIGVWKETSGVEASLAIDFDAALNFQNNVPYRVRFRVNQVDAATTFLQAKIWPAAETEPAAWQISFADSTPELQGISGGIALDSWSNIQSPGPITAHTLIDDIEVRSLCNPLWGRGQVETITESLSFSEGPVWQDDHLLFSDISADTIYRLDLPMSVTTFRTPSDNANGLALLPDGRLLAAEHGTRSVTRTEANDSRTALAETYQGQRLNSPTT